DLYLNTSTNLDLNGITSSTFTITNEAASAAPGRFRVLFSTPPPVVDPPLSFTAVNAYDDNGKVKVEWEVDNEKNIVQYDVEKSSDGAGFTTANSVTVNLKNNSKNYKWQ